MLKNSRTIVVKIGSNVLTNNDGSPDKERMENLVKQMAACMEQEIQVVLVTSGAVAFGRKSVAFEGKTDPVIVKQVLAAVGQVELIQSYKEFFSEEGIQVAQLMVTKE